MNDADINNQTLDGFQPIEEDDQVEYGFLDEAIDNEDTEDVSDDEREDEDVPVVDDDPDRLDVD